jgi:hypothetical protein
MGLSPWKHGETWWILVDFGGFLLGKTLNH